MVRGELNPHPIQLLVNYWEIQPSMMGARLDELLRNGVTNLTSFVPWQAVESDISHTLTRFLQALAERKMTVSLILTPEVGVHYLNSGLPKDLFSKAENTAKNVQSQPVVIGLPPNAFALPSLMAPEYTKRYHNFLSRMDNLLADLCRSHPQLVDAITITMSGSFWKYYRSSASASLQTFGGLSGDFSGSSSVAYRQRLEQHFSQQEFADPDLSASNRWKTRALEPVNRRWFFQQCEDVFRARSLRFVRRKALALKAQQIELFTPEADPAFAYSNLLQLISGGHADFAKLSVLLEDCASRASAAGDGAAAPFVHWTALGGFQTLSDSEKQFLILKGLLLLGGRGGGLMIDESEWFALSSAFRARAESLARLLSQGELRLKNRALYLGAHLWSSAGPLWTELRSKLSVS